MQHLYLLRHGQSQANADGIIAGSRDSSLSVIGEKQATFAGETAKLYLPFELIVSSPMDRSLETARLIARQLGQPKDVMVIDDLHERNLGAAEGKDYRLAPQHNGNYGDAENIPGIEPIKDFYSRINHVLVQLRKRPEKHVLIVCHNGSGRMLQVAAAKGEPMDMYQQPRLENAVFYQLT